MARANQDRAARRDVALELAAHGDGRALEVALHRAAFFERQIARDRDVAFDGALDAEIAVAADATAHAGPPAEDRLRPFVHVRRCCRAPGHTFSLIPLGAGRSRC